MQVFFQHQKNRTISISNSLYRLQITKWNQRSPPGALPHNNLADCSPSQSIPHHPACATNFQLPDNLKIFHSIFLHLLSSEANDWVLDKQSNESHQYNQSRLETLYAVIFRQTTCLATPFNHPSNPIAANAHNKGWIAAPEWKKPPRLPENGKIMVIKINNPNPIKCPVSTIKFRRSCQPPIKHQGQTRPLLPEPQPKFSKFNHNALPRAPAKFPYVHPTSPPGRHR